MDESTCHLVELFRARLKQARSRAITVRIAVTSAEVGLSTIVLPAVRLHSYHIVELSIEIPTTAHAAVFVSVSAHMPLLQRLTLRLLTSDTDVTMPLLPYNTFQSWQSAKIRYLELLNIDIPPLPLPVLTTVLAVNMSMPASPLHPRFFHSFPNMKSLLISGN